MFKNVTIKVKLVSLIIGTILFISLALEIKSIISLKKEVNLILKNSEELVYKVKEEEVKNYVSLAYKTVESYYERTSKEKMKLSVEKYLKGQTNFLFSIITAEYEKNKDILSEEELFQKIKSIISVTRFDKNGYFFGYSTDGVCLILPPKPHLEGKSLMHVKDRNGVEVIKGVVEQGTSASGEGYVTYEWPKPGFDEEQLKVSYVKMFKPLNLIVGTGAYIDDVSSQMQIEALKAVSNMKYGESGYFWVNDSKHIVKAHGVKTSLVGKDMTSFKDKKGTYLYQEIVKTANAKKEGGTVHYYWSIPGKEGSYRKISYVKRFEPWDMIIGTGTYVIDIDDEIIKMEAEVQEEIRGQIMKSSIVIIVIILLISLLVVFMLNKVVLRPLVNFQNGLLNFFKYLNKEQTHIDELKASANDEIGSMVSLINENISKTKTIIDQDNNLITDVKDIVNSVGNGYLDKRISNSTNNESLEELKNLLNDMLDNLESLVGKDLNKITEVLSRYSARDFTATLDNQTSGKIGNEITQMNKMITEILKTNQNDGASLQSSASELTTNVTTLSNNATSQAASLEETAASIDEITSNIEQTSQKAQAMSNISNDTKTSATDGKKLATDTVNAMDEINETVININEAISVIDQIAFQTNILSLNAAVEAATAGEAGKGFAVVAQEVRNLASRSAEAAKEIKELVEAATTRANNGKNISSKMIEGFSHLEEKVSETNKLIDDVTNAAKEQSIGMTQISDAINQLDRFTQENASVADRASSIAEQTNSIALGVVENVNKNNFSGKMENRVERKAQNIRTSIPKVEPSLKRREVRKSSSVNKKVESKVVKAIKDNDNEWESF